MAELGLYSYCLYGKNQCYILVVISWRNFISTFMKKASILTIYWFLVNDIFTCIKRPQFYPLSVSFFFFGEYHIEMYKCFSFYCVCTTWLACFHFFCNTGVYVCSLDGLCNASVFTLSHLQTFHLLSTKLVSFKQIQFFYTLLCCLIALSITNFNYANFFCLLYPIIYLVRD